MYFFFDESGDYAFPKDRFDCYVQAALICPGSVLPAIEKFEEDRKAAWGVRELHATKLDPDQLLQVAEFIGGERLPRARHSPGGREWLSSRAFPAPTRSFPEFP